MAAQVFPTRNDIGRYTFRVELDGGVFGLDFRFNVRDGRWYYDLLDAEGVGIRHGLKVVSNWPTLRTMVQQGRPDGDVYAIRPNGTDDPDRDTLGVESFLTYAP